MDNKQPISKDFFRKRLADLCLKSGLPGFPKNELDQHILLKSAVLLMEPSGNLTEREVNEKLDIWVKDISRIKNVDRVTLRRGLVDSGYLTRSKDGSNYQIVRPGPRPELFEAEIDQIDPVEVISAARDEIERRKRAFQAKSKGA